MRKPIVPRFLFLLVMYPVIFITLVQFQFAKKTNFTLRAGDLVIQGNYGTNPRQRSGTYVLSGPASVFFGGMEFILGDGLELTGSANTPALPQLMSTTDNEVYFRLDRGPELVFTTQYTGGAIELVIRADFSASDFSVSDSSTSDLASDSSTSVVPADGEAPSDSTNGGYHSLKIPFRPLSTSVVQKGGRVLLVNSGGVNYTFNRDTEADSVVLETQHPAISYRVLPDKKTASPQDFIIPAALDTEEYEGALALWLDQSYLLWNRTAANAGGEITSELICAYMSESLKRGTYRAASAAVSASWNPANAFYEASAYIGRFDSALRSFSAAERERSTRLARLFNEKSVDFLKESHIIEFLAVRGYDNLLDDAAGILRTFDPASMTAEQAAGILEGRRDWGLYRQGRHNPFDRFVDQALFVITGSLRKNPRAGGALVFTKSASGEEASTELNLRLGRALLQYDDDETALGRTLILSVLSLADRYGAVPRRVRENFTEDGERLDSQHIYRICFAGENYARSQIAGSGLWAWTAASSISGSTGAGRLDLLVRFPAGETHYMIIRGIKPFTTLQFNGYAANQDNQFERYDSSGWTYSAAEQTLLLKIRHRLPEERITILY